MMKRLFLILILLLACASGSHAQGAKVAGPSKVVGPAGLGPPFSLPTLHLANSATASNVNTLAISSTFNVAANDGLIVSVRIGGATAGIAVNDTAGNSFTLAGSVNSALSANIGDMAIYYSKATNANATDTITCSWTTTFTYDFCEAIQIVQPVTFALDQTPTNGSQGTNTTTLATGSSLTTQYAYEILVAAGSSDGFETYTAGAGYTLGNQPNSGGVFGFDEYYIVGSIQTAVTPGATQSPTAYYYLNAATFRLI